MRVQPYFNYNNVVNINFKAKQKAQQEKFPLTKEFNIHPENVAVISNKDIKITDEEKATLIEKVIEAHLLAKKNYCYGNIASAGYATNIGLENGLWSVATNFNNTRSDISSLCGERAALVGAYNDLLKKKTIIEPQGNDILDFKVKYMAMSSNKDLGTNPNETASCSECLSWFNTTRYFTDDTIIASLIKDKQGKFYLKLSKLEEYVPFRKEISAVKDIDIENLPISLTKNAYETIKEKGIEEKDVRNILKTLEQNYDSNELTNISTQNIQAAVVANGELFTGSKVDFSKRWHIDALQFAAGKAIEKYGQKTDIDLIAIVGDSIVKDKDSAKTYIESVLNLKVLGALNTKYAKSDALVITNTDKGINIRTISDIMPDKFKFNHGYEV